MEQFPGPDPGTPNPNACVTAGATRTVDGATSTKQAACGLNGQRTDTYKEQIVQICQMTNGSLSWVEQSKNQVLVSEGACMNQSCTLAGQAPIANGGVVHFSKSGEFM
jgi:DnaJ-class molecular chaperone